MSTPELFYREIIDLNRYSVAVSEKFVITYNEIILNAAKQLRSIDQRQVAEIAKGGSRIIAPVTRKRLRAIIKQSKDSLDTWWARSALDMKDELQGVAELQRDFVVNELKNITASGDIPINSVAISKDYADSVIMTDPSKINIFTSKKFTEDDFVKFGSGKFSLTSLQGATIKLPNGQTVQKAFRGIAESSAERLDLAVRSGVFAGETLQQISRRLVGRLDFDDLQKASVRQMAQAGGELTKLANHQIQTIVRTSVNQVTNQASQAVYAANKKVAPKYEYVATLDSKTSAICPRLDGQKFDYNNGPTPPQHFNCRSTTVPVVDFDGLQKKYPNLEKPPTTQLVSRPSATGRVPQGTQYGDWLLNQDKELQVKTLGSEGKVNYFKRLAGKEGSGQKALRKLIRNDGTKRTLKDLERLYGKPSAIKPVVKAATAVAPPVAPPEPTTPAAAIKTSPVLSTDGFDNWLAQNKLAKNSQQFIEESLDSMENLKGETGKNIKKMRKFMKKNKVLNHFNLKGESTRPFEQLQSKFLTGKNLDHFEDQYKTTVKRFDRFRELPSSQYMDEMYLYWPRNDIAIKTGIQQAKQGLPITDERFKALVSKSYLKNATGNSNGFTNLSSAIVHTRLRDGAKKINATFAKKIKKSAADTLENNARIPTLEGMERYRAREIWSNSHPMPQQYDWFSTFVHEMGHQVHFEAGTKPLGNKFSKMKGMKYVTEYSRKNPREQFAEAFTQYIFNPEGLKEKAPRLYAWVDETINFALEAK